MKADVLDRLVSPADALRAAAKIAEEARIRGMRPLNEDPGRGGALFVEFSRASGVNCALAVSLDCPEREPVTARRGAEVIDHVWIHRPKVSVTWSSTDRTVATATAALALYREVVELAALIDTELAPKTIGFSEERMSAERAALETP